jgi:site-specific DNA recombinase
MRLSREDGSMESSSIGSQRRILRDYARSNGLEIVDEYIDDGYSGTNFERPSFQRMIDDIEREKIDVVLTKDLSRLGRNYILTGQYTEVYFPAHKIRYIAVNDGYDSEFQDSDIVPFKNIINEMYARDISRKIKSAQKAKMKAGEFISSFAPYGYKKKSDDKNKLIVDEESAKIVRYIFERIAQGSTPSEMARELNGRNILCPIRYRCKNNESLNYDYAGSAVWSAATISKMLKNEVYIGNLQQGRTEKITLKSKKVDNIKKEDWIRVEDTHERIVSKELFDIVQRKVQSRSYKTKSDFKNIFSGIAKCADCGRNMSTVGTRKKDERYNLACGGYKASGTKVCTSHFISYNTFYNIVLTELKKQINLSKEEQEEICKELKREIKKELQLLNKKSDVKSLLKRTKEIDLIIEKLYEDSYKNVISNERYNKLLNRYELEQKEIDLKLLNIRKEEDKLKDIEDNYKKFIKLIKQYTDIQELDQEMLFKLIEKIEVDQGYYEQTEQGKIKQQGIKIYFRFAKRTRRGEQ